MDLTAWLPLLMAVLAGSALALQPPINAQLRVGLASPYWASCVSFIVGALSMALFALARRSPLSFTLAAPIPWWAWIGGCLGAFYVTCALMLAPRLGVATLVALVIAGQLITSLVVDQFGLFGVPVHPIGWARVTGALLLLAGVMLIHRP